MNRSWSPHMVRIMPGQGLRMQSLPPSLTSHWVPSSRRTTGSTPKNGRLALPGLRVWRPGSGVIRKPPVSVCHQVSTIGHGSRPMFS